MAVLWLVSRYIERGDRTERNSQGSVWMEACSTTNAIEHLCPYPLTPLIPSKPRLCTAQVMYSSSWP